MKPIVKQAREVIQIEAEGLLGLIDRVGDEFADAVEMIYESKGRVIVTGIGKSGLVGRKIVATLNSTGTPSLFLHPVEAVHGDLGMVCRDDVVLAISNSGETQELIAILSSVRAIDTKILVMTGDPASTLAQSSDVVLDVAVQREACPMGLAPTASTTATLAMGDALAVALIKRRNFSSSDFRRLHPGGSLGERLSVQVREVMITGRRVPVVPSGASMTEALKTMNKGGLGVVVVLDDTDKLAGIYTDGDLRRTLAETGRLPEAPIDRIMTRGPKTISQDRLAADALEIMQTHEITVLPIADPQGRLIGIVHLHDLLGKGKFRFNQV